MLEGYALEVTLTTANAAAQAWYGYEQGIIAGILISPHFLGAFPQLSTPSIEGIFISSFALGNLVGCILTACLGDWLGRRKTLWVGALISATGGILQAAAYSFPMLMVGRVVSGLGNGMTSATCGVYQAEATRGSRRGKMSVIVVLHNVVFYMIGSWLTLATSYMPNSGQWRVPFALQLFPACFLGLLVFTPESPRWLVLRGRDDEAIESLRRYLGKGLDFNDPLVQDEYRSIKAAVMIERQANVSLKEVVLCRDRSSHLKRMLLGMGGQFMQQLGGINALNYYFSIILKENLGMSDLMARILTGANATSYCISTAMAFWIIDRRGRRFLMLTGLVLQGAAYVMVAVAVAKLSSAPQQWGAVAITFLFAYYASFGCTWLNFVHESRQIFCGHNEVCQSFAAMEWANGVSEIILTCVYRGMVPWIYQAEINSLSMRTRGASAAVATNWIFGFVCTQFTSVGIRNLGYKFYIMFAVFNVAFIPIVYFLYPETANRTLEDLDDYFDKSSPHRTIIRIGDKVAKQHHRPAEAIEAERRRVESANFSADGDAVKGGKQFVEHVEVAGE